MIKVGDRKRSIPDDDSILTCTSVFGTTVLLTTRTFEHVKLFKEESRIKTLFITSKPASFKRRGLLWP